MLNQPKIVEFFRGKEAINSKGLPPATPSPTTPQPLPEPPRPQIVTRPPTAECLWAVLEFSPLGETRVYGFHDEDSAEKFCKTLPQKFSSQATQLLAAGLRPPRQGKGYIIPMQSIRVAMGEFFNKCVEIPQPLHPLGDECSAAEQAARSGIEKYAAEVGYVLEYLELIAGTKRFIKPDGKSYLIDVARNQIIAIQGIAAANPGLCNVEAIAVYPDLAALIAVKEEHADTLHMARTLAAHLFGDVQIPETVSVQYVNPGVPFRILSWAGQERLITAADLVHI